ncbi:MAG TPA: dockerin type I domain-containing protein [Bacillota bacterium]|nr:dockerin type I domain-containing protein [Bacillota bacterium]
MIFRSLMAKSQQFDTWMARGRLNIKRSIALFLVAVLLSSACFTMALYAAPPEGEEINRIGYTNSANGSYLRSQPTTDSSRLSLLPRGTRVEVFVKVTGKEVNGVDTWYYVRAISLDLEGYVHSPLVTLTDTPIVAPPIIEDDHDFEYHLADQGFPESYKPALRALHKTYPEWIFIAHHIIDFDTASTTRLPLTLDKAVYEEIKRKGTNLVGRNSLLSHRSYLPGDYNYKTDEWTIYDAGGWVGASREIVAYSIDARNFLNEQQIFQFELLSYNRQAHTIHAVEAAIVGTFMEGKSVTFTDHRDGTERTLTYPEIFIEAAEITNVSPFFLVQRCLMEVGRNGSGSVSGTVEGYEGYYNFYNIGATAGTNPVLNGLKYARYGSTGSGPTDTERERYWLPWNNQWRAIVGGAFWIGRGYINAGQDTQYSQKFNLDGDTYGTYWHQYMGNVYAPYYEAARVFEMYLNENLLHMPFVFKIPVLAELPEEKSPYPTSNKSLNNWLKSITVSTGTLTPEFDPEVYSYTVSVDESVNDITLTAESYHASCTINNTGNHTLTAGANTIVLEAVAERGEIRPYTVVVNRGEEPSDEDPPGEDPPDEDPPGEDPPEQDPFVPTVSDNYVIRDGFLLNATPADTPEEGRNIAGKIRAALEIPEGMILTIKDAKGNIVSDDTLLGTGATFEWYEESSTTPCAILTLVIYGDVSGNGKINSNDMSYIIDYIYAGREVTPAQLMAMDASRNGVVNSNDLSAIIDYIYKGRVIPQE